MNSPKLLLVTLITLLLFTACSDKEKLVYVEGDYPTKECREEIKEGRDFSKEKEIDSIIVSKTKREMYLYKGDEKLYTFRVSLGKHPKGNKIKQGDYRTPIGSYSITRKSCNPNYYRMIYISYPNAADRKAARERGVAVGSGITIHAQPFWNKNGKGDEYTLAHDWTNGCIALSNSSMNILWYSLKKGTPIIIKE